MAAGKSAARATGRRKKPSPPSGTFRPGPPKDGSEVLELFAIAARVVCSEPGKLDTVSAVLAQVSFELRAPLSEVRDACSRLWNTLARTLGSLPPGQENIAGRAFVDDLDRLGQRLELMPLPAWEQLPDAVNTRKPHLTVIAAEHSSVEDMVVEMKEELSRPGPAPLQRGRAAARVLTQISPESRASLIDEMLSARAISKPDAALLSQFLAHPTQEPDATDEALVEALESAGRWLVSRKP